MRRNLVMLVALALLWGASFMFIKIADRHLAPATLILGRLGLGALTLALIVPFTVGWRGTVAATRENWRWLLVVALLNTAAPFWLLAWGETRIDSGLASIVQGAVPIFNVLFAFAFFHEVRIISAMLSVTPQCSAHLPLWGWPSATHWAAFSWVATCEVCRRS